jgi:hypothetical protein
MAPFDLIDYVILHELHLRITRPRLRAIDGSPHAGLAHAPTRSQHVGGHLIV